MQGLLKGPMWSALSPKFSLSCPAASEAKCSRSALTYAVRGSAVLRPLSFSYYWIRVAL